MGAFPEKVSKYTGVTSGYYADRAVGYARALELLQTELDTSEFIVSFAVEKFQRQWLQDFDDELRKAVPSAQGILDVLPILDVTNLVRIADDRQPYPEDIQTVDELQSRLQTSLGHKKGYGMEDVCARCVPGYRGPFGDERALEKKPQDLWDLWRATLDR